MDWEVLYGQAVGILGIRPCDFWDMTLAQYHAAFEQYLKSQGIEQKEHVDREEAKEIVKQYIAAM